MKKILSFILLICLLVNIGNIIPLTVSAAETGICGENLTWTLEDDTLTIEGVGDMNSYSASSNDWAPWGWKASNIESIVIKKGVTTIGNWAFSGCSNLKSVSIPSTLNRINTDSFGGRCKKPTTVYIDNLENYCNISFGGRYNGLLSDCENLYINGILTTELNFSEGIRTINDRAFSCCSCINAITFPESLESIGSQAFYACEKITTITLPNNIKEIGEDR